MKKWMCRVTLIGVLSLCGCGQVKEADAVEIETSEVAEYEEGNSELDCRQEKVNELIPSKGEVQSSAETQSNTKEEQKDALGITAQIALIVREKDLWLQGMDYANDMVGFTITDMDSNGRLELVASNCGGTGHYTHSRFFEVSETYDGLTLCETNFQEGDSQPDIMDNGGVVVVYEDAQGIRYYLFEDMLHDVADYYYINYVVSLQNGTISGAPLAINRVSYGEGDGSPVYTYMTGAGELISKEEYIGLIGNIYNEEFRKYIVNWTWLNKRMVETVSDIELEELLLEVREATTWNTQEKLSHYGKWKVEACVGYAKVSAVSQEEVDSYIGKEMTYTKNEFNFGQTKVNLSEAGYGYVNSTKAQFIQDYNVSKLDVEIPEELVWCSVLTEGSHFGEHFAIIADDRLLIYYEGAFFEAVRVEYENKSFVTTDFTFADVSNLEFFFCSGAGGWWTEMHIGEDGSFAGYYVDSNWGIVGDEHPNGQVSYSEFHGSFTEPVWVDDYTYQVQIDSIEYPKGNGSEIIDGVLYDYGEAYGLQGGENFCFYLPGKKYQELPEDFRLWVNGEFQWTWKGDIKSEDAVLPFYGFFNVEQGCGFYSYEEDTNE